MTKKIKISDLPEFDLSEYLKTDEEVALYLTSVLDDNDSSEFTHALELIAKIRGMEDVARNAGLTCDELDKALCKASRPTFETIARVCTALGVKLVAESSRS
ncbi:MAG: hypothetical protein RL651_1352 [Pseudomonadota bacterium]|jgi:probable addiction module antidote protein